ncbi:hypothetical protein SLS58_005855 [Diplodia intermedia]|uniref:Uncharacterized protein n=1 Tax=Diplodia intermedia TaxID=856260 RepID=A0ABR3TPQ1_9PEZI
MAFVFAAQKAAQHIESMYDNGKLGDSDKEFAQLRARLLVMEVFGRAAQDTLSEAQEILTERLIPRPMAGLSKHIAFGPSLLVAWIMRSLVRYETNHHPRKRLLRDINLLEEELNAILRVVDWQREAIQSFMAVLDHRSYRKANGKRQARYAVEQNVLISALRPLATYVSEYRYLAGLCPSLSKKTNQSTEINEEDHGKAILVFTIVTAIFLPLSFVTSYLGMNTTDIRDTGYDQSLFWIISLPLTVTIMALILGIAYNGDDLRTMLSDLRRTGRLTQSGTRYKDELIQVGNRRVASSSTNPFSGNSGQGNKSFAGGAEFESPFIAVQNPFSSTGSLHRPRGQHRSRQQPSHVPTYVRIHRDHIAIETLNQYGLPWQWDQSDPNYFIILREMDPRETDILFEHTRRLRSSKKKKGTPARFFGKPRPQP